MQSSGFISGSMMADSDDLMEVPFPIYSDDFVKFQNPPPISNSMVTIPTVEDDP